MPLSVNAKYLLQQRYMNNRTGDSEPEHVYSRTARVIAKNDEKFEEILYDLMLNSIFLPNSPALFNAGLKNAMLHACFTLPIHDDLDSIFNTVTSMAKIFKGGGGVGVNFSELREVNAKLSGGGTTSGVISFMKIFDNVVDTVKQGGKRRGALMGILKYTHPEIFNFIKVKLEGKLQNFNLSIMVDDDFMNKVISGGDVEIKSPTGQVTSKMRAKDVFEVACFASWVNGDLHSYSMTE